MRALHVRFCGLTASFRHPLIISGTQIATPMPGFSNILGMLSACAGRAVTPTEVRIGFEFRYESTATELERKDRLQMKGGQLRPLSKANAPKDIRTRSNGAIEIIPQGIGWRQFYWMPQLDIYLSSCDLRSAIERPAATPRFGRSQDIAWIDDVAEITLEPRSRGAVGPTLLPAPCHSVAGLPVRLAEWFSNDKLGRTRTPGPIGSYVAMLPTSSGWRFEIERGDLFHPSDAPRESDVIYLHQWQGQ